MPKKKIFAIEAFRGVNRKSTETLLQPGEASYMSNWIITDDMKLQKAFGYSRLFDSLGEKKINGMWCGSINGQERFIFACNGHVYEHNLTTHVNTDHGTLADAYPTTFFASNNTVYILDGSEMYQWTGTGSISTVAGYVPTVATASPPSGGGTVLESINYLTGKKTQKFSANGTATVYQLLEYQITGVDSVYVNGALKTQGTDYTVNLANGTVIFTSAPAAGTNNVVITWTKTVAGDRTRITRCRYYGGIYHSRFWLYGNPDYKNTRFVSGVTMAGVSDPTYWPKYADSNVGEYEITGIVTQYSKQIIFTAGTDNEASAWYSTVETYTDESTGILVTLFPVYPINEKIGNVAPGQVQIIMNNPFTIWKGVYEWQATYVSDEKNARWVSERIQRDLDSVDLTKAITADWSEKGLYLLCVDKTVWVLNYRVDAWYRLDLAHSPTCFAIVSSSLCFGTTSGTIMRFDESAKTFDGQTISAVWKMGYHNFGVDWLEKFIQRLYISLTPRIHTHVDISYETDKEGATRVYTAEYRLTNFDHVDFNHFSFKTNYGPQPFRFKIKAKKIDYFRLIISNDGDDSATVLSITLPVRSGSEVRRR